MPARGMPGRVSNKYKKKRNGRGEEITLSDKSAQPPRRENSKERDLLFNKLPIATQKLMLLGSTAFLHNLRATHVDAVGFHGGPHKLPGGLLTQKMLSQKMLTQKMSIAEAARRWGKNRGIEIGWLSRVGVLLDSSIATRSLHLIGLSLSYY